MGKLGYNKNGLCDAEVEESRRKHGDNVLTPPEKESIWHQFIDKFKDPIIKILLIAWVLSLGVSCYQYFTEDIGSAVLLEPLGILVAILLATTVGFVFELSANKKFELLNQANDENHVKVIRNGYVTQVERKDVVVGDIVIIETGDEIPADGVLLESISLLVNESDLTGEPVAHKSADIKEINDEAAYPCNYLCRGSSVVEGHGMMRVEKVGDNTEWGKVYQGSQIDNKVKTPLNEQLDRLGNIITIASYVIAALVLVLRMTQYFVNTDDEPFMWMDFARFTLNTMMIAVTVIVVAVPEGLPMSVTLSLALSMKRMLMTNNLVRKMHACETMGAATVICSDKTGTLTKNQMSVGHFAIYGLKDGVWEDSDLARLVIDSLALNTTAFLDFTDKSGVKAVGNPTEAALLLWLFEHNIDYIACRDNRKIEAQLPFSTKYKYMATVVNTDREGESLLLLKGAPEIVMSYCSTLHATSGKAPLSRYRSRIDSDLLEYQSIAMRTIGFAYRYVKAGEECFKGEQLLFEDMTFIGVAAIADPIRDDVAEAIGECMDAGIKVKVVTGDTVGTAKEIARQIGLWEPYNDDDRSCITGRDFEAMSDEMLLERLPDIKVVSRARPSDKERLVRLLQRQGEVVAVTGDGTNDAPALNAAQIGLSMGDGTVVAKEASDITILDNSFKSIARAVLWGRSLYLNIQRFILFQMTINVVACLIVLLGAVLGVESPLTVTQMLWVNLIMDTLAALALASLPPDASVMQEKPRKRDAYIITKDMAYRIFGVGILFVVVLFGLIQYFKHCEVTSLADFSIHDYMINYFNFHLVRHGLSDYELTLFFTIFVFLQFWNLFNVRVYRTRRSAFSSLFNKSLLAGFGLAVVAVFVGQIMIVTLGHEMFNTVPLQVGDWIRIVLYTSSVMWFGEILRLLNNVVSKHRHDNK